VPEVRGYLLREEIIKNILHQYFGKTTTA